VSICRELPLRFGVGRTGALDNLMITSMGGLVLVEAKLWRDPEARRSVVAQAMEYAAAVFRMNFDELRTAVRRARAFNDETVKSIYELVSSQELELDEVHLTDAVARNLKRGRAVIASSAMVSERTSRRWRNSYKVTLGIVSRLRSLSLQFTQRLMEAYV
jgi:hypothetical protein